MKDFGIPFPSYIFTRRKPDSLVILQKNWDSDPEKFIENLEKYLGIKTKVLENETIEVTKRDTP